MSGRSLFVRCFLIAVNLAVVLMAIGLLLLGSRFELFQTDHLQELFGNSINWRTVAVFAILVSFVTGIVALFGLGAAFCYSACLMNVYAYFLVLITIAILFFNGALFYFHGHIAKEVTNVFTTSMQKYGEDLDVRYLVQFFQSSFLCCGVYSASDWASIPNWQNYTGTTLPPVSTTDLPENRTLPLSTLSFVNESSSVEVFTDALNANPNTMFYPSSCCASPISLFNTSYADQVCPATQLAYLDGCFSTVQMERYQIVYMVVFTLVIVVMMLLLALTCCLERDRKFFLAQQINKQYANHLNSCHSAPVDYVRRFEYPPMYPPNLYYNGNPQPGSMVPSVAQYPDQSYELQGRRQI